MDYRILGPLEIADNGSLRPLTGTRQRALLTLLLLHRNEVVSPDRLIDGLWGASPPSSAAKALQNAVSQVRRALADGGGPEAGPLRTEGGGYVLRVAPEEVDADRFEALLAEGRRRLEDARYAAAAERLREALALWRGPALADVAYEAFAQPEIARLEEERLAALEERIEADLALGRHAQLIGEIEAEVARHPLRERLRGQLMLALYRSGRQADALEAFHGAREALVSELGIEPGPALRSEHEAMLRQDAALDPPAVAPRPRPAERRPRSGRLLGLVAAAALVLLAGAVAAAVVARGGDGEPAAARAAAIAGNSVVGIDLDSGRVTAIYPAGSTPASMAAGAGGAWALNADDGTLTRVDPHASAPRTFGLPGTPLDVAAGAAGVWALTGVPEALAPGLVPNKAVQLSPETGEIVREVPLTRGGESPWFSLNQLALGRKTLWVIGPDGHLLAVDARAPRPPATVPRLEATAVTAEGDGAWAISRRADSFVLTRVSSAGRVTARVPVVATDLDGIAAGLGAVWVTAPQDGLLWRVTPDSARSIDVGPGARGVAVGGGAVWVANATRGTVSRVDPQTNRVTTVIRIGNAPRALAADADRLWVSVAAGAGTPARDSARAANGAVTAPACGAVIAGAGRPDRLIVSDLPLHQRGLGGLTDAIAFVLRSREFRAGRFRIGYQSCDDSTLKQGGFDPEKCRANAELYASTPRVIGIVGPYNSDCAAQQLGVTNRAPDGPLGMVSPTNTALGLTKPVPGAPAGHLHQLYPTGRRHYVRLQGADDGQGAALARFAHDRGIRRLAIVEDAGDDYARGIARYTGRTAGALGIAVTTRRIDVEAGPARARALARRIARGRPDALLYAGVPYLGPLQGRPPAFVLVRELRALVPDIPVLGPDSWADGPAVRTELGPEAHDVFFSYPGVPLERLPAAGRRFVAEFGATQPGGIVSADAVYTAQATAVLLDAIARSDGTRPSVARELFATDAHDQLIGDISFDGDGDIRPRPFSILRLGPRTRSTTDLQVGDLVDVVSPP